MKSARLIQPSQFAVAEMGKIDPRERQYALLVVGEFIMERYLIPVLQLLGFYQSTYSWRQVTRQIELRLTDEGPLRNRKNFLLQCIQFILKRNEVAHPTLDAYDEQIWHDFDIVKVQLTVKNQKQLRAFLEVAEVSKPKGMAIPYSGFGNPKLGITEEAVKNTLAFTRLFQFLLDRTMTRSCQEHGVDLTLSKLRDWKKELPFLSDCIELPLLDALVQLFEIRNKYAHPRAKQETVHTLVATFLSQEPEYESFLKYL